LHFPTLLVLTQITWTFCVPLCFLLRFNSHCPILFTGNIFHYWLGLRVCNLFSNRPLSDCMASYCVILGALQAILQRNHGAVIERRQSVQERVRHSGVNSGPGNRRIPILFTGNIFHYCLGPRVCNLLSNHPHSDCVASYCVILGALQAFLQ
jgi:hypothetical protein